VWVGKNLVPRLMFYSFFFLGAFGAEVSLILLGFVFKGLVIEVSFYFLTVMTAVAMVIFLCEGLALFHKIQPRTHREQS
jgi:hypothetical protein